MLGLAISFLVVFLGALCVATAVRGWKGYCLIVLVIGLMGILLPFAPSTIALVIWYLATVALLLPMIWFGERGRKAFENFFTNDVGKCIEKFQKWNQ